MGGAEALIFPTLAALALYKNSGKKKYLFVVLLNSCALLIKGSRSVFFCVFICMVFCVFWSVRHTTRLRSTITLILAASIVTAIVLLPYFVGILYDRFPDSRTVYTLVRLLEYGDKTEFMTGHDAIAQQSLKLINDRPIFGYGLLSDRYYLSRAVGFNYVEKGLYPHNMLLELILQFGIPAGVFIFLCVIFIYLKLVRVSLTDYSQLFTALIATATLVRLMFTGSWVNETGLFLWIGLYAAFKKKYHSQRSGPVEGKNNSLHARSDI